MKKGYLTVRSNKYIADRIYQMVLEGEIAEGLRRPGQFLHSRSRSAHAAFETADQHR